MLVLYYCLMCSMRDIHKASAIDHRTDLAQFAEPWLSNRKVLGVITEAANPDRFFHRFSSVILFPREKKELTGQ